MCMMYYYVYDILLCALCSLERMMYYCVHDVLLCALCSLECMM